MSARSRSPFDPYQVSENGLYLRDNTNANASTTKHGLLPKLSGDVNQVLRGDGTFGAVSTTVGATGGGRVLLSTVTANNTSGNMDLLTRNASGQSGALFQSDYGLYEAELVSIVTASATDFALRVAVSGSVQTGATAYMYSRFILVLGITSAHDTNSATDRMNIAVSSTLAITSVAALGGTLKFIDPLNASSYKRFTGQMCGRDTSPNERIAFVGGVYTSASAIDGLRFLATSGNVVSGTIRVYGIPA
jgi:hypothetical protein